VIGTFTEITPELEAKYISLQPTDENT